MGLIFQAYLDTVRRLHYIWDDNKDRLKRLTVMDLVDANNAEKKPGTGWEFFDRIYCISLEEREDRRLAATAQFSRVGLDGKVEFIIVKTRNL